MENWGYEMWWAIGISGSIGLIIGVILSIISMNLFTHSVKKHRQTKEELDQVKNKLNEQTVQLEKHFTESAELMKTLAGDWQKLYRHFSSSSETLLSETQNRTLFLDSLINKNEDNLLENHPPKDYSEGASGLFKKAKTDISGKK